MADSGKRVLIVTGQKPIAQVGQKSGGSSTLYEVYATDENGETIEEPLRTFAELEEGVAIEYDITRYNHPQYGTSYTLTPPKRNSFKRLRELEEQMEDLLAWALTQGYKPMPSLNFKLPDEEGEKPEPAAPPPASPTESIPAPENAELDERFGKEAPWTDDDLDLTPPGSGG